MKAPAIFCFLAVLSLALVPHAFAKDIPAIASEPPTLTLIGHASVKIKTSLGSVVYIDPYHPGNYGEAADLLLISHGHSDHSKAGLVTGKEGCLTLRVEDTINKDGSYNTFEHLDIRVEPFPAYNKNHKISQTNGFLITFDGITVYFASDTGRIPEMETLAERRIHYALFPIDGQYNMGAAEAMDCAAVIGAEHNIPMHFFSADPAQFTPENLLFIPYGETVTLQGD